MGDNQVQEVKDRLDIAAVIGTYVSLEKKGRHYKGLCPFHEEKTPSFVVSPEMQIYKCFGCGKGGDVFNFLMEIEGLSFAQALDALAEQAGVKIIKRQKTEAELLTERLWALNDLAAKLYSYLLLKHPIGKNALDYLKKRAINETTIENFRLGYSPHRWDFLGSYLMKKGFPLAEAIQAGLLVTKEGRGFYDRFRGRLMFPLIDPQNHVLGFSARALSPEDEPKYLNSPETAVFSKSNYLYGFHLARTAIVHEKSALLVEGMLDVCSLHQAGLAHTVAPMGTALTSSQLNLLSRLTDTLTFCFDGDEAGIKATKRAIGLAQEHHFDLKVLPLPAGRDPDEMVRQDKSAFINSLRDAVPAMEFYFREAVSRFDLASPQGKKKFTEELLPLVEALPSAVEKNQYLKKLADLVDIKVDLLAQGLDKKKGEKNSTEVKEDYFLNKTAGGAALEEYLLSLLLKAPLEKAQKILHRLGRNDFESEECLEVFLALKEQVSGTVGTFDLPKLRPGLDEGGVKLLERCYLRDLGRLEADADLLEDELEGSLQSLKNRSIKRELRQISLKIRVAELNGDTLQSEQLQQQFNVLTQKLNQRR